MSELEQLKDQVREITKRIIKLEGVGNKVVTTYIPKIETQFFLQGLYGICTITYDGDAHDKSIISRQRVYPTKQLAEANDHRKEKIAVWNKFREMETEAVDWNNRKQNKYVLLYCHENRRFKFEAMLISQHNPETEWYTTSANACEWVIANMQTELKKIWRLK